MGQNKAQKEAAARAKKSTSEVQPAEQPKQEATAPTTQPATVPATPNKQTQIIEKLKAGWTAKGVNLDKLSIRDDGKFKLLIVDAGWPTIRLGSTGGITVVELKSYPDAFTAAMEGLERYTKQQAREQKKTVAAQPATASQKAPAEKAEKQLATA